MTTGLCLFKAQGLAVILFNLSMIKLSHNPVSVKWGIKNTLELQEDCTVTWRSKLILGKRVEEEIQWLFPPKYWSYLEFLFM